MDEIMKYAVDWAPSLIFCLTCYVIVQFVRSLPEGVWPRLRTKRWWNPGIMHALPVLVGLLGALPHFRYPFPPFISETSIRLFFGMLLGFLSSMVYKAGRAYVKKKYGVDLGTTTQAFSPVPAEPPAPTVEP